MTGVAITTIVNKTTTLTGIIAETPSNVPTITPKGIIVITKILVVMTTSTGGIILRILAISRIFATTTTTTSVREITTPTGEVVVTPQGYDDSPPREYHQGDDGRQYDTSNRGNRNTDSRQYNENQYEDERATESRMTPRASIRVTDNSRLLESRDTRIPEDVGTVTRTADAPRKRALPPQEGPTSRKRQASPPGSMERPTYVRTYVYW